MKKLGILTLLIALVATSAFAWQWPWAKKKTATTLTMAGSTTVLPIAQVAAEKFMELHPRVNISVRGGGSGVGLAALIDQTADIANTSRPIKTKEIDACQKKGINPVETVVARDSITIITHPTNRVKGLTLSQLKDIYTGKISNWKDVGGKAGVIVVISRDAASGTFEAFSELALNDAKTRENALMLASNQAVATTVAQTPTSIGYTGLGYCLPRVKTLKIDGVMPGKQTVVSGKYKLARSLFMYTNGRPKGLAKQFLDFILSAQGQKIVEEAGYVPIK